jgi:hypothetical protein
VNVRQRLPRLTAVAIVLVALMIFVWNAVQTSGARVNATTSTESIFSAGTVELAQIGSVVELLFDVNNLYPGKEVVGCVEIEYRGSVPADVRLHARSLGGTGLEEYVDVEIALLRSATCEEAEVRPQSAMFDGALADVELRHGSYKDGLRLGEMTASDSVVVRVLAQLMDDNEAQGLTTEFSMTVEARP